MFKVLLKNCFIYKYYFARQDEGYTRLALSTADRKMRPDDKAYTKVEGCYEQKTKDEFFLQ
jgi:hypothetical protein